MSEVTQIDTISIEDAAKILGKNPQFVRLGLQQGTLPFGAAVRGGSSHISCTRTDFEPFRLYGYGLDPLFLQPFFILRADDRMPEVPVVDNAVGYVAFREFFVGCH